MNTPICLGRTGEGGLRGERRTRYEGRPKNYGQRDWKSVEELPWYERGRVHRGDGPYVVGTRKGSSGREIYDSNSKEI